MNHSLLPIFISYIFNVYFIYCILRSSQTTRSLVRWLGCASQRTNGWSTTQSKFHLQHIYGFHFVLSVSLSWFWSVSVLPFFCMCLSLCQMAENTAKKVMHGFNTLLCQGLLEVPIITVMVKIYLKGTPWQKLDYVAKKSAVVWFCAILTPKNVNAGKYFPKTIIENQVKTTRNVFVVLFKTCFKIYVIQYERQDAEKKAFRKWNVIRIFSFFRLTIDILYKIDFSQYFSILFNIISGWR